MRLSVTPDPVARARRLLTAGTRWRPDGQLATLEWWSNAELLAALGPALAGLHPEAKPTLIVGVQSSGYLLAPLVATRLGVGMVGIQKQPQADGITNLATAHNALGPRDRVLLVDDVVETGSQALAVRELVLGTGASWLGMSAMVGYRTVDELNLRVLHDVAELHRHTAA